jgi:AAA15 family ATPase/GTPase
VLLRVKGIGKILDSQIKMDGITVIAGENNTGKSTFGKVLYCMFNAFCNIEKTIYNERVDDIRRIIFDNSNFDDFGTIQLNKRVVDRILSLNEPFSEDSILEVIEESQSSIPEDEMKRFKKIIYKSIDELKHAITVNNTEIQETIITRYFRNEFQGQINHLNKLDLAGNVFLDIKKENIEVVIENNQCCAFVDLVGIVHDAIYIDSPFVIDEIRQYYRYRNHRVPPSGASHRLDLRYRLGRVTDNTVIEEAIIKQKINTIVSAVNKIVAGEFKEDKNDLLFVEYDLQKPIALSNLSAGLKVFVIIKRLLENGQIREKGVLILDEPEIHLHPDWQLKFAEILVLLQKEFNLTILLTTHSPYFLEAIEVYGKKHGVDDRCNYYLAEVKDDTADVREVNGNLNDIYRQLASPFRKLENIALED